MTVFSKLVQFVLFLSFVLVLTAARFDGTLGADSYVSYAARTSSHAWEGRAPVERLTLSFDEEAPNTNLELEITLNAAKFNSGNFARDINARRTVFDTDLYPEIVFTGKRLSANTVLSDDGEYTLELSGTLSLHGVSRDIRSPLTLVRSGSMLTADGLFEVLLSDFDMKRPSVLGSTVEDKVVISYHIETVLNSSQP